MPEPIHVEVGDVIQLRKKHPCGADTWTIQRLGADVILYNADCDRKITLTRAKFNKRVKSVVSRNPNP